MAKKKDGTNNQKIGRNSRNPSGKLQKQRTEKNKRIKMEKAAKRGVKMGHVCPPHPRKPDSLGFVVHSGLVADFRTWAYDEALEEKVVVKMPHLVFAPPLASGPVGVVLDVVR